jgi:hypothetical protein
MHKLVSLFTCLTCAYQELFATDTPKPMTGGGMGLSCWAVAFKNATWIVINRM